MPRTITKGLIGFEDINVGVGTFTRATSTGGTITLHQVNASNLSLGATGFPTNAASPVAPTGAINGVNTVFTLPTSPGVLVLVFRNGVLQQGGAVDYSLSGSTITFVTAPLTGDSILAAY